MLSFLFVSLLCNPEALQTAQREVDTVIGKGPVTVDNINKLPYLTACLRETLRLWPPAPGSRVHGISKEDKDYPIKVGKRGYTIYKDDILQQNLLKIHRDPLVYGPDAGSFKPERMLDGNFEKLPPNAWKVSLFNFRQASVPLTDYHSSPSAMVCVLALDVPLHCRKATLRQR